MVRVTQGADGIRSPRSFLDGETSLSTTWEGQKELLLAWNGRENQAADRAVSRVVDDYRRRHHGADPLHPHPRQAALYRAAQADRCAQLVILGLILQQAILLGALGFGIA